MLLGKETHSKLLLMVPRRGASSAGSAANVSRHLHTLTIGARTGTSLQKQPKIIPSFLSRSDTRFLPCLGFPNTNEHKSSCSVLGSALSMRTFSTTDGPFRHIKPRFVDRKRRYESVLVTASVKTLMQAAESCIIDPMKQRSTGFWEILVKRSIASIPLMNQLELGLIGRALDVGEEFGPKHLPRLREEFAKEVAKHFRLGGKSSPSGQGIVLLVNLLAPVDAKATLQVVSRMPLLMWDLSVRDLAFVVNKCVQHDISCDLQSTRRMAMKVSALRERMSTEDLLVFLRAFVKWGFRDVDTFNLVALEVMSRNLGDEAVQKEIASSFQTLSIIPPEEVERIMSP